MQSDAETLLPSCVHPWIDILLICLQKGTALQHMRSHWFFLEVAPSPNPPNKVLFHAMSAEALILEISPDMPVLH